MPPGEGGARAFPRGQQDVASSFMEVGGRTQHTHTRDMGGQGHNRDMG